MHLFQTFKVLASICQGLKTSEPNLVLDLHRDIYSRALGLPLHVDSMRSIRLANYLDCLRCASTEKCINRTGRDTCRMKGLVCMRHHGCAGALEDVHIECCNDLKSNSCAHGAARKRCFAHPMALY